MARGALDGWGRARLDCTAPSLVAQRTPRPIYSDTDVSHAPMIAAFRAVGDDQRASRVVAHALEVPTGGLGPS